MRATLPPGDLVKGNICDVRATISAITDQGPDTEGVTLLATITEISAMDFAHRLATLRKERGITQPDLAERIGVHVSQLRRYEGGTSQPTLDVLRRMARALGVSADVLIFDEDERGPQDPGLRQHLAALDVLDPDELAAVRTVIEGTLLRHQARRLAAG
jgi:transcriptional regulator with XRE-family HTH domain